MKNRNFDLLSAYSWFIPGYGGLGLIVVYLIIGTLISNAIAALFLMAFPTAGIDAVTLISYPLIFIPAMMYASVTSRKNAIFGARGIKMDSGHFGSFGGWGCASICMIATVAMMFLTDIFNSMMPPMPSWIEKILKDMTQGNLLFNFISVALFAPFFEEWLCRGVVLRGLLYFKKQGGDQGIRPIWAIVISAAFFAVIHMNPWHAVPAFMLGCLFGYVYFRTGSLKLTMLMHATNNTIALIIGQIDSLKDANTMLDIMPLWMYGVIALGCVGYLYFFFLIIRGIETSSSQGNCDELAQQN